jgi:hypothetical protein
MSKEIDMQRPDITATTAHRIAIAGTDLQFRNVPIADPIPTGRQIAEAAGGQPADEHIVLQWLVDGDLEEIDLDETTDLKRPGVERFIVARSDRTYRFEIDGRRHEWPLKTITREVLLALAGQDPAKFTVWQEIKKAADVEILSAHPANLDPEGTERFYTVMKHTTEGCR